MDSRRLRQVITGYGECLLDMRGLQMGVKIGLRAPGLHRDEGGGVSGRNEEIVGDDPGSDLVGSTSALRACCTCCSDPALAVMTATTGKSAM
jgi:hypothetical protein